MKRILISDFSADVAQGSVTGDNELLLSYSCYDLREKKTNLESLIQGQYEIILENM